MKNKINDVGSVEGEKSSDETKHSVWLILFMCVGTYGMSMVFAMAITAEVTGLRVDFPLVTALFAIGCSILHPGGWLAIAGLVIGLVKRKLRWLILSAIGGALTGVTIPYIEAIGAASI